jgi:hypothetical protein
MAEITSLLNGTQNTNKISARHTFQPWQPPSSHSRLGAPHPLPRHKTISQDHSLLFLLGKGMVGSNGVLLWYLADVMVGGCLQDGLASNLPGKVKSLTFFTIGIFSAP